MFQKIDLENIDAIIFDLGGVILNIDYELTINAFKSLGKENFDDLYTQARQNKVFDQFEKGQMSGQEFVNYLKQFLPDVQNQQIIDAWNAMLLDLPENRISLLNNLKKDHKIFLFSNTNAIHIDHFKSYIEQTFGDADLLEKTFHKTYYSHIVNERKPNSTAFNVVLKDNELIADRTLFIDDSIQHIQGAKEMGIKTYHLLNEDITSIF